MNGMAGHTHTLHKGAALETAAQAALEASGEQWTPLRAQVFEALRHFDKPASAYDIAEQLSKTQGRRIAANTVYRILDLFVAANLTRKVESANAYIANAHPDCVHDCIFLVCDDCGRTTHVDNDVVTAGVRATASKANFVAQRPVIEVRGLCETCVTSTSE